MWYKEFRFLWLCVCLWCVKNYKSVCGGRVMRFYLFGFVCVVNFIWWCCMEISCCDLLCIVSVSVFIFCSLWRRWTYKYMLNKIYLAVTRMDFFWSRWFLYWYDFLSNLLYNCACVWWGFYADGFLCYKFIKNINIIYYLIICNNL